MRAVLPPIVRRRTRPPLALGILVAVLCIVAETLLAGLLQQITPVRSLNILYLLGIVTVASVWGLWLGMATAMVSTVALDYFLIPPTGSLTPDKGEDWTVLAVFLAVTLLAGSISKLARSAIGGKADRGQYNGLDGDSRQARSTAHRMEGAVRDAVQGDGSVDSRGHHPGAVRRRRVARHTKEENACRSHRSPMTLLPC